MKRIYLSLPLVALLAACGSHTSATSHTSANTFKMADANNDGHLTYQEFVTLKQLQSQDIANETGGKKVSLSTTALRNEFNNEDSNHDGVLSRKELGAY